MLHLHVKAGFLKHHHLETTVILYAKVTETNRQFSQIFPRIIDNDMSGLKPIFFTAQGHGTMLAGKAEKSALYTKQPCCE